MRMSVVDSLMAGYPSASWAIGVLCSDYITKDTPSLLNLPSTTFGYTPQLRHLTNRLGNVHLYWVWIGTRMAYPRSCAAPSESPFSPIAPSVRHTKAIRGQASDVPSLGSSCTSRRELGGAGG